MTTQRLVVVRLDRFRVGLDVHRVLEVLAARPVVPVPGAPPAVRGLVNLRGQLASVIAARTALGLPPGEESGSVHVVIRSGPHLVVLEADGEEGLVDVTQDGSFETPGHVPTALAASAVCVHPLGGGLVVELDIDHVLRAATRSDATPSGHSERSGGLPSGGREGSP